MGKLWNRIRQLLRNNISLVTIFGAAILLELTSAVMYYSAQRMINRTMQRMVEREMNTIDLSILKHMGQVEVAVNNMAWIAELNLSKPDTMFLLTRCLLEHNEGIKGCNISFIPNYYPQKGYWFEAFAGREENGAVESKQLASSEHDYTKKEFFSMPLYLDRGYWSEPYMDSDGAKAVVVNYGVPVHDPAGKIVAVVNADISLSWLDEIIERSKSYSYKSMRRYLVTGDDNLLSGKDDPMLREVLEIVKADTDKEEYLVMDDEDGKKSHVFYHAVGGNTNWLLISVCHDSEVLGPLRDVRRLLMIMALSGLLLLVFIVYRLSRNLEKLRQVNAEKARIDFELRVAGKIQTGLLPSCLSERNGLDVVGFLAPAREVGGDIYDYFIRDDKLFFCIGDVSGKGIASAILMAITHALFRSFSANEDNPALIMKCINEASCRGNDANMFVTLFIGVLDLSSGRLQYCNAGHNAPYIISDGIASLPVCANLPIGVFDSTTYGLQELTLQHDSTIFLYTDGLTEAMNQQRCQFGKERVEASLKARLEGNAQVIIDTLKTAVREFVDDAEQSDDLTMLAIHYNRSLSNSVTSETLVIRNDLTEMARFNEFFVSLSERFQLKDRFAKRLRLAVEEIVVNVIEYAYSNSAVGEISIAVARLGSVIQVQVVDAGIAFDPTSHQPVDISLSLEERRVGGLGIMLARELMDAVRYERVGDQNVLTMTKKIE